MLRYKVLLSSETYEKVRCYMKHLEARGKPGRYLAEQLKARKTSSMKSEEFIELLINTKLPQIYAESDVCGDGSDWNHNELSILGDVNIATSVLIYDNGRHYGPEIHSEPFPGTLLFVPGALLRNGRSHVPADWDEITKDGNIDHDAYYRLYERRLLPSFMYANELVANSGKTAFITIPGLGCGQFAGKFRGQLGQAFKNTLESFLENHGRELSNIKAVYYDPYSECEKERSTIQGINFLVRPLTKGNESKPQLCQPEDYEEEDDNFSDCELFSFVAWDHVSWPGNDFYAGFRATDDGVKAAATDVMAAMTGVAGDYNTRTNQYDPPPQYRNWQEVIRAHQIQLQAQDNLLVFPSKDPPASESSRKDL